MVVKVLSENGREIFAKRVLLCTGAFTNFHSILPGDRKIDFIMCKTFVVKVELSEQDAIKMLDMPSILLDNKNCYVLPPIKYPDGIRPISLTTDCCIASVTPTGQLYCDMLASRLGVLIGKYYVKLGFWCSLENKVSDLQGAAEWFRSHGKNSDASETINVLRELIPGIRPISLTTDCCIASVTPTGQLYCDMLTSRLGVLIGLNYKGAKSSSEIGRMGASMISKGSWNYDLNPDLFKVQYRKNSPKSLLTGKL
eukprot:XP_011670411.1 PREDICTED: uncharacterized protein LOC100891756 [Strongylocentrotus purpuratus]